MRVLFMGSPDFAIPTLEAIIEAGHEVVGVLSQPDKPRNRGQVVPTPVKAYALSKGLPVETPNTLKDQTIVDILRTWEPDVIVVVAYGKILPRLVLDFPRFGCLNVHGSILPAYRGAAPMQRAIIDGQTETGVTIMYMSEGLDTGDMICVRRTPITQEDNFETIHDRLAALGAEAMVETLAGIRAGTVKCTPQPEEGATYAAKIEKGECRIDFAQDAQTVHNLVRGLSPIPLAFTYLHGKMLKLVQTEVRDLLQGDARPGEVLSVANNEITVACKTGALAILSVVPEGKRKMAAGDFIRGRQIAVGDLLTMQPTDV